MGEIDRAELENAVEIKIHDDQFLLIFSKTELLGICTCFRLSLVDALRKRKSLR